MNPLYWSPKKLEKWRKSLRPGDPVRFNSPPCEYRGVIDLVFSTHYSITYIDNEGKELTRLRLRSEVYPITDISQAPQRCDLGLTRPTAKRQVDHSGQSGREWYKRLPGLPWLFCSLRRLCNRSTMDPGGSPERG